MAVRDAEFEYVRSLVRERIGVALGADHAYLVESRLAPLARDEGIASVGELIHLLMSGLRTELSARVAEALATHETSFFRDPALFEFLGSTVFPEFLQKHGELRVWSAAASTGQEALSLAMLMRTKFPDVAPERLRITATDVAHEALAKARRGRYSQLEVNRGLPASMLVRWFERAGTEWQVRPELSAHVDWRLFNLVGNFADAPRSDVVLLRNVMIYFEEPVRQRLLRHVHACMNPGGWLFLGSAEMLRDGPFQAERCGKVLGWRAL